jgi:hypothetical protein
MSLNPIDTLRRWTRRSRELAADLHSRVDTSLVRGAGDTDVRCAVGSHQCNVEERSCFPFAALVIFLTSKATSGVDPLLPLTSGCFMVVLCARVAAIAMAIRAPEYPAVLAPHRLYEQQKRAPEGALILGKYVTRWLRWTGAGLAGVAFTQSDVAGDGRVIPLVHLQAMSGH